MSQCDVCDDKAAVVTCEECGMSLCAEDDESVHKPAKLAGHARKKIGGGAVAASPSPAPATPSPAAAPAPAASNCELCEEKPATIQCKECDQSFCASCEGDLHKPARMVAHTRTQIGGGAPSAKPAEPTPAPKPAESPKAAEPAKSAAPATPAPATPVKPTKKIEEEEKEGGGDQDGNDQNVTPVSKRSLSGSASASSLGRPRSSSSRPRSGSSTRSSGTARAPLLEVPASLAFAPKALQQALSPARNVLSMSFGSRWEEPDLRPYQGKRGTFGHSNRDGSPKKNRNLLYSKSASDLLGAKHADGSSPIWERLAKPKVFVSSVISPLFDDNKNCTFRPAISPLSQTIAPGAFPDRLALSVKLYKDKRLAPEGTGWNDPQATFKPKLNHAANAKFEKVSSTPFVTRMYEDLADRKTKLKQIEESQLFSFQPIISESSKKRAATIKTPFLDRLKEDLDARDDGKITRKAEADKLPYSFQPNPDRLAKNHYSFNVFLGRMENDLDERKQKYDDRCRKFGIPPPDEVAAAVRAGSAPRSRK